MRYVNLGRTPIKVSVIGFGAWAIGGTFWGGTNETTSEKAIRTSIDSGINFIDTAPGYGLGLSEKILGKAIKGKRDSLVIATKCGIIWEISGGEEHFVTLPLPRKEKGVDLYRSLGEKSIRKELEASLSRLGTDYIDLYQIHVPDPQTPVEETMNVLLKLKEKGLIRAIGVSNISIDIIKEFHKYGVVDSDQEQYSIIDKDVESKLLPWCRKNNISMIAYSSMSKGLLTGKLNHRRKFTKDDSRVFFGEKRFMSKNILNTNKLLNKFLGPVAKKHNSTIGNIAVAYLINQGDIIALCGARNEVQAAENAKAGDIILDAKDIKDIKLFISNYKES